MAPAGGRHGSVAMRLGVLLGSYVLDHDLGETFAAETGFVLGARQDTVLAPDAAFVSAERLDTHGLADGFMEMAPDLAVEVTSSNDRPREVREKVVNWLDAGTRMVWVIEPASRTATVHRQQQEPKRLSGLEALTGEEILPGFSCLLGDLFRE